ncbi:MAG: citrate/2-methylcitrate synthase [Spirochaetota bacterium]
METATGSLTDRFLDSHASMAESYSYIDPELHKKYNTKRGLRNEDGTGVLIGLTEIGEVHGYVIDDVEKVPTDGRLFYRGLDVYDIVRGFQADQRFGFEEVVYLLLFGHLPSMAQLEEFKEVLGTYRQLPESFTEVMILNHASSDIMNKLARSVLALYSYDDDAEDLSVKNVLRQCISLIAMFPGFVAYGYQAKRHYYHEESLYIHTPKPDLSTAENLLLMIRPDQKYTRLEAETLDLCLALHAEHGGGNNSAFSVHVVSSAATDTYSAIATGVGSLKGAKHGGASAKVASMMNDVKANVSDWGDEEEVAEYLRKVPKGEAHDGSGLIYGIGHAVYTLSDPRAVLLKEKARELAGDKEHIKEFDLYTTVERLAPKLFAEVKKSDKPLAANVDFFSGFVYKLLNIPEDLYTPIFAVARVAGWSAHRIEELVSGGRIIRPAYKNVVPHRKYVSLKDR